MYIPLFNKPKLNEILNHLNEIFFRETVKILILQTQQEDQCYLKFALKYFVMQNETNVFIFWSELTLTCYSLLSFKPKSDLNPLTLRGIHEPKISPAKFLSANLFSNFDFFIFEIFAPLHIVTWKKKVLKCKNIRK